MELLAGRMLINNQFGTLIESNVCFQLKSEADDGKPQIDERNQIL